MRSCILWAICWLIPSLVIAAEPTSFAIVGYLPSYRVDTFRAEQVRMLTDVILFAVEPRADGTLDESALTPAVWQAFDRHLKGSTVRRLVTVGGWGKSDAFARVTADSELRTRLVDELAKLCDRRNLRGIDVDWEHPVGPVENENYAKFLQELHARLTRQDCTVTTAIAPWKPPPAESFAYIDRVHLMAYDNGGRHSTLDLAFDSVDKLLDLGVPPQKICLGIPFYGRPFEGDFGKATTYADIVGKAKLKPSDNETGGVYFNGPEMVARKVRLARRLNLGGVMIWEIGQDTTDADRSLLRSIQQAASQRSGSEP